MSRRRVLGALTAGAVLLSAGAALAATSATPGKVDKHGEVKLEGQIEELPPERIGVAELRLTGPGVSALPVAKAKRREAPAPSEPSPGAPPEASPPPEPEPEPDPTRVSFTLRTAPCNLPGGSCTVLPNGSWTVRLFEVDRATEPREVERGEPTTFVVDVPALAPQDVTAALSGRTVTVQWARGGGEDRLVEPDVRWTVDDGEGRTSSVGPEACAEGRCSVTLEYPTDVSGARTFTLAAQRPGSTPPTTVTAAGEVVVPAPPSPSASPGGTGRATARSFGQGFAPGLGLPKLPPLPKASAPSVAAPLLPDTFDERLDYGDEFEDGTGVPEPQAAPPGREGVLRSTGGLLDNEDAMRGLAGAMVLMMAGAHLRTWLAGMGTDDLA